MKFPEPYTNPVLNKSFLYGIAFAFGFKKGGDIKDFSYDYNPNHNPKNGEFATKGTGVSRGLPKGELPKGKAKEVCEKAQKELKNGKNPLTAVTDAAKELKNHYIKLDIDGQEVYVGLDNAFVNESRKQIVKEKFPDKKKEVAGLILFAMSNMESLIKQGSQTDWGPAHDHPTWEIKTYTKRFLYNGISTYALLDVRRLRDRDGKEKTGAYSLNAEGIKSFKTRAKELNLKISRDSVPYQYEIVGIRFK